MLRRGSLRWNRGCTLSKCAEDDEEYEQCSRCQGELTGWADRRPRVQWGERASMDSRGQTRECTRRHWVLYTEGNKERPRYRAGNYGNGKQAMVLMRTIAREQSGCGTIGYTRCCDHVPVQRAGLSPGYMGSDGRARWDRA